jgi:hypothetical protein
MTNSAMRAMAVLAVLLGAVPLSGAGAQIRPDPTHRPEPAPQSAPNNPNAAPPERVAPPLGSVEDSGSSGSLSDRLSRSHGTIAPPKDIDPGITATPPDVGAHSMPVIPPPGGAK